MVAILPLPAVQYPRSALLDFTPLTRSVAGLGQTLAETRNRENSAVAGGRLANKDYVGAERAFAQMGQPEQVIATQNLRAQKQQAAEKALVGAAQMIQDAPQEQRGPMWGRLRSTVKDLDADMASAGFDPNDYETASRMIIAKARGYVEPKQPEVKEVNGRLVRVNPGATSATEIYAPSGQGGAFKDAKQQADVEEGLRREFTTLSKDFVTVREAKNQIEEIAKEPSAGADVALVYSFMKILDPNSVVRETEYATAQNAAGVPDQVRNVWNRILAGERLNPAQRSDFVNQARKVYGSREKSYRTQQEQYRGIATRKGLDPQNTMIEFAPPPAPGGGTPQPGAIEDGYRFKGGNPADPNSWEPAR